MLSTIIPGKRIFRTSNRKNYDTKTKSFNVRENFQPLWFATNEDNTRLYVKPKNAFISYALKDKTDLGVDIAFLDLDGGNVDYCNKNNNIHLKLLNDELLQHLYNVIQCLIEIKSVFLYESYGIQRGDFAEDFLKGTRISKTRFDRIIAIEFMIIFTMLEIISNAKYNSKIIILGYHRSEILVGDEDIPPYTHCDYLDEEVTINPIYFKMGIVEQIVNKIEIHTPRSSSTKRKLNQEGGKTVKPDYNPTNDDPSPFLKKTTNGELPENGLVVMAN